MSKEEKGEGVNVNQGKIETFSRWRRGGCSSNANIHFSLQTDNYLPASTDILFGTPISRNTSFGCPGVVVVFAFKLL